MAKSPVKGRKDVANAIDAAPAINVAPPAPVAPQVVHTFNSDLTIIVSEASTFARVTCKQDVADALKRRGGDAEKFKIIKDAWRLARFFAEMADAGFAKGAKLPNGETLTDARAKAAMALNPKDSGKNLAFHGAKGDAPQRTQAEQVAYGHTCDAWNYFTKSYGFDDPTRETRARAPRAPGSSDKPAPAAPPVVAIAPEAINVVASPDFAGAFTTVQNLVSALARAHNANAKLWTGDKGERVRRMIEYAKAEMAAIALMN